jgi:hypothetical protein
MSLAGEGWCSTVNSGPGSVAALLLKRQSYLRCTLPLGYHINAFNGAMRMGDAAVTSRKVAVDDAFDQADKFVESIVAL